MRAPRRAMEPDRAGVATGTRGVVATTVARSASWAAVAGRESGAPTVLVPGATGAAAAARSASAWRRLAAGSITRNW